MNPEIEGSETTHAGRSQRDEEDAEEKVARVRDAKNNVLTGKTAEEEAMEEDYATKRHIEARSQKCSGHGSKGEAGCGREQRSPPRPRRDMAYAAYLTSRVLVSNLGGNSLSKKGQMGRKIYVLSWCQIVEFATIVFTPNRPGIILLSAIENMAVLISAQ
ncbi:hypothetical protein NDU88_006517 [Pleurodeles waltl]|uniref:Uncharacterized protein n=1 Tax=Pleurodeles waltl TaxID=8319 RepID=A0AAV7MFZ2_PLEWA|nr:hypothetical protein NDU88_006517 [Pleurodeles waltl]